jgi:hypothetical protein
MKHLLSTESTLAISIVPTPDGVAVQRQTVVQDDRLGADGVRGV